MTRIIYLNGMGTGRPRRAERLAMKLAEWYLARRGISLRHVPVNWYAKEPFADVLARTVESVREELKTYNAVTLCGVSAGGSLAVDIFGALHGERLSAIVLCGPLKLAKLPWWDGRTMEHIAFRDPSRPSHIFFDSVTHCSTNVIPVLSPQDKRCMITVHQWADTVVPRPTMGIPGVRVYHVPGVGHTLGIGISVLYLPKIIKKLAS